MGLFGKHLFDMDGITDMEDDDWFIEAQLMAGSRKEAIELTGDDTFYPGDDESDEDS